jgi:hypothetical protein
MEYGLIVPQGIKHFRVAEQIATHPDLPEVARMLCTALLELVTFLSAQIGVLEKELRTRARQDELASAQPMGLLRIVPKSESPVWGKRGFQ